MSETETTTKKKGKGIIVLIVLGALYLIGSYERPAPSSVEQAEEWLSGSWEMDVSLDDSFKYRYRTIFKEDHSFVTYSKRVGTSKKHDFEQSDKGRWSIKTGEYIDSEETYYVVDFVEASYVLVNKKELSYWRTGVYNEYKKVSDKQSL